MSDRRMPDFGRLAAIVTAAELAAGGLTKAEVRRMVGRGTLVRLNRGTYAQGTFASELRRQPQGERLLQIAAAVAAAGPYAVASHHDAAVVHGLDLLEYVPDGVCVTRAPGQLSRKMRPGIGLHVASLPGGHVTNWYRIPVTTPARTVVDLARASTFRSGVVTADSALHGLLTTKEQLEAVIGQCARWPGIERAREVVAFADGLAESPFESVTRVAFSDWGLPRPELQVWLADEQGSPIGQVDFYWRRYATIAEADGAFKYDDRQAARKQFERDARLQAAGFQVVHITWRDLHARPDVVLQRITAAFRRQAALRSRTGRRGAGGLLA
jgi:hypothetical protein